MNPSDLTASQRRQDLMDYIGILMRDRDRYEKVRVLNASQFARLYRQNIETGEHFDDLVDKLPMPPV